MILQALALIAALALAVAIVSIYMLERDRRAPARARRRRTSARTQELHLDALYERPREMPPVRRRDTGRRR